MRHKTGCGYVASLSKVGYSMGCVIPYTSLTRADSSGTRYIQVVESRLHTLIRSLLPRIDFDEEWYLQKYGDVADAVEQGRCETGKAHYVDVGYFENRFPREIMVDPEWYLASYPDVAEAIRRGRFEHAQQHFEKDGFREGRLPYAEWEL